MEGLVRGFGHLAFFGPGIERVIDQEAGQVPERGVRGADRGAVRKDPSPAAFIMVCFISGIS